ncbi:hypothetical protein NC652_022404 [Populus alba x Populus x berolinensis]|nr:hypothetical protein NC652_022404 [Populus alba x Populus x berolinensis]
MEAKDSDQGDGEGGDSPTQSLAGLQLGFQVLEQNLPCTQVLESVKYLIDPCICGANSDDQVVGRGLFISFCDSVGVESAGIGEGEDKSQLGGGRRWS